MSWCLFSKQLTDYWLPFIKTTRRPNEKPQVVLVGSHLDKCDDKHKGRSIALCMVYLLAKRRLFLKPFLDLFSRMVYLAEKYILNF